MSRRQEAISEARLRAAFGGGEVEDYLDEKYLRYANGNKKWSYASGEARGGNVVAEYVYSDKDGEPYLRVERTEDKQFPQSHWDGKQWKWGKPKGPKIPYMLPNLMAAKPETPIFICEGEKDAENLIDLGLVASCASEGAGKWTEDLNGCFADKQTVYILEDNDEPGRKHARQVAQNLKEIVGEVRIVALPGLKVHGDVSDWLAGGGTKERLLELCAAAPIYEACPVVTLNAGQQADAVDVAMGVIAKRAELYVRGTPVELVRLVGDGIAPVTATWLQDYLNRHIAFQRSARPVGRPNSAEPKTAKPVPTDCPTWLPEHVLAKTDELKVPVLDSVITAPTLRADGSLLIEPGYDPATKLLLIGDRWPTVPSEPTRAELRTAWEVLWRPFEKFPFETAFDKGVMLASLLTALVRRSLPLAPAFSFDAPQAGTGKTLLGTCVLTLTADGPPSIIPECGDNEEVRKRLLSILRQGVPGVLFDNIRGNFKSSAMEMLLTSENFSDRVLGINRLLSFRSNVLVLISGNNFQPQGDLWRRILTCRINASDDSPEARYFDLRPLDHCRTHRRKIILAGLTILQGFIAAGRPTMDKAPLGSFESWDALVRQSVLWLNDALSLEIGDPVHCVKIAKAREPELDRLARFLKAARTLMNNDQWTVAKLVEACKWQSDRSDSRMTDTEEAKLAAAAKIKSDVRALLLEVAGERGDINTRRFGHWLVTQADKRHEGLWLARCAAKGHGGTTQWQIQKEEPK